MEWGYYNPDCKRSTPEGAIEAVRAALAKMRKDGGDMGPYIGSAVWMGEEPVA